MLRFSKKPLKKVSILVILSLVCHTSFGQKLTGSEWLGQISAQELRNRYGNIFEYGVDLYKISYRTTNWDDKPGIASGLVVLPLAEGIMLPLVIYMHGTVSNHDSVPSNLSYEAQVPIVYGGVGAISFAPDYLGFSDSESFHPYHHADSEGSNAVDMISAVLEFLESASIQDNGQLFISGYSQGGHAAAALHRRLERMPIPGLTIAASAFMSGAYSLSGVMLQKILSDDEYYYPAFVMNLLLSYNMVYGLYSDLRQLFVHPYDELAMDLFTEEVNLGYMNEILRNLLMQEFGTIRPKYMIQDSVLQNISNNPNHQVIRAMKENDVFDWAPQAPVMLIYCREDEQVPFYNAILADSVMRANGANNLQLFEADANADHFGCAEPAVFASLLFFSNHLTEAQIPGNLTSAIRIFPNPAGNFIQVESCPPGSELILSDMQGRPVLKETLSEDSVNLELDLPQGIYAAIVRSKKGIWRGKIVVGLF